VESDHSEPGDRDEPRLGVKAIALAAAFYVACVSIATWPRILGFRSYLPSLLDPLQHLWIMRWYKACVFEGQSLLVCPEAQYPTGAPLGCFSPLHFQALLYIPLSLVFASDVLCYNIIWLIGMISTGLGTFLLAWRVVRDPWCAAFGGMLAMLSAPMLFHASAHLELIFLGVFPLFLWTWMRLLEQPSRGRLLVAVGAFVLVALCAAYYAVFAVFPAALYFFWKGLKADGVWPWFRARGPWLVAFSALVVPCLAIVFGNQIWAIAHGFATVRPFSEFHRFNTALWTYWTPSGFHALGKVLGSSWYAQTGFKPKIGECCSYLGVAAVLLLAYTAAFRVRFREMSYWWLCLALLVVLSGGTAWIVDGYEIRLPGYWLKKNVSLFQMVRVPSRFNLFAAVIAAVVSSCGLHHVLLKMRWRWLRRSVLAAITVGAIADLAMVPYFSAEIPKLPGCYAFMERTAPGAAFVEVPQAPSTGSDLYSICAYWQSFHRGRTSAGYCGQGNAFFDDAVTYPSPFYAETLERHSYLEDAGKITVPLVGEVAFGDYVWLYLHAHDFRFVVVHNDQRLLRRTPGLERLQEALVAAKVYEDESAIVYDRDRLELPRDPVLLTTSGWRPTAERSPLRVAAGEAQLLVYNPDAGRALRLRLDAQTRSTTRHVRLLCEGKELARCDVRPGKFQKLSLDPLHVPAGLHVLVLASDDEPRPRNGQEAAVRWDMGPFRLRVRVLQLEPPAALADRSAEKP
jgi:hypothetical protein